MSNIQRGRKVEKHYHPEGKRTTYSPFITRKKRHLQRNKIKAEDRKLLLANGYRRRVAAGVHAYLRTIEQRAADSVKIKTETKQNETTKKRNARENKYGIGKQKNARRIQVRESCG